MARQRQIRFSPVGVSYTIVLLAVIIGASARQLNLLMLLGTLVTNKLYLGWERHTWDPIVLGLLLVAAALGVRRWLLSGPGGQRYGFTPHRLLSSDLQAMTQLSYVTAALKPDEAVRDASGAEAHKTGGGRSGGAGASGGF